MQAPDPRRLSLYMFRGCPYCTMVERVADQLGLDIERRDIFGDRRHLSELMAAQGRRTVPVLRVDPAEGDESAPTWMPESSDIIRWLRATYATRS